MGFERKGLEEGKRLICRSKLRASPFFWTINCLFIWEIAELRVLINGAEKNSLSLDQCAYIQMDFFFFFFFFFF